MRNSGQPSPSSASPRDLVSLVGGRGRKPPLGVDRSSNGTPSGAAVDPSLPVALPVAMPVTVAEPLPQAMPVGIAPAIAAKAKSVAADDPFQIDEVRRPISLWRRLTSETPSWLVSAVFHCIALLFLARLTDRSDSDPAQPNLLLASVTDRPTFEEVKAAPQFDLSPVAGQPLAGALDAAPGDIKLDTTNLQPDPPAAFDAAPLASASGPLQIADFAESVAPGGGLLREIPGAGGGGGNPDITQRRSPEGRRAQVAKGGAGGPTDETERAVALALKWIEKQQLYDGSWAFAQIGRSANPGTITQRNGATGLALLPFLGAGNTHRAGSYVKEVDKGLEYLQKSMQPLNGDLGSLHEPGGMMYSHGIGSIALCEAYAMTRDKKLHEPAQMSLNFISYAQDPIGGGWRYLPRDPGDTSVLGWQVMALKSGQMAYLEINPQTIKKAKRFLDSVQTNDGARYGYTSRGEYPGTTAVGLLSRMYLGWKHDTPALVAGIEYLSEIGPSDTDMYYNYYATQVMRHYGGDHWEQWNYKMRSLLLRTQDKRGPEAGSWYFADPHGGRSGGRLYTTCMAAMILEVYYRHLPLYGQQSVEDEFPN